MSRHASPRFPDFPYERGVSYLCRARTVIDGDSVYIEITDEALPAAHGQVVELRLWGIDAPEGAQPGGEDAMRALREMLRGDLRVEIVEQDHHGRLVGILHLLTSGVSANRAMVERGWAYWYEQYAPDNAPLRAAQAAAQAGRRGVWAFSDGGERPWAFRRTPSQHHHSVDSASDRSQPVDPEIERRVHALQYAHEQELQDLRTRHWQELETLGDKHDRALEQQHERHQHDLRNLREELQHQHYNALQQLRSELQHQHYNALQQLRSELQHQHYNALQQLRSELLHQHSSDLQEQNELGQQELQRLLAALLSETRELHEQNLRELRGLHEELKEAARASSLLVRIWRALRR